jgi:hypothetical protein
VGCAALDSIGRNSGGTATETKHLIGRGRCLLYALFFLAGVVNKDRAALFQEVPAEETAKPDKKWLDDYVNRTKFFQGTGTPDIANRANHA